MEIRRSSSTLTLRGIALGSLPIAAGLLLSEVTVDAQQALRSAVEGDRNLAARIQQSGSVVDAPFMLGPVRLTAGVGLDLTFTDNSRNTGTNPEDDSSSHRTLMSVCFIRSPTRPVSHLASELATRFTRRELAKIDCSLLLIRRLPTTFVRARR